MKLSEQLKSIYQEHITKRHRLLDMVVDKLVTGLQDECGIKTGACNKSIEGERITMNVVGYTPVANPQARQELDDKIKAFLEDIKGADNILS